MIPSLAFLRLSSVGATPPGTPQDEPGTPQDEPGSPVASVAAWVILWQTFEEQRSRADSQLSPRMERLVQLIENAHPASGALDTDIDERNQQRQRDLQDAVQEQLTDAVTAERVRILMAPESAGTFGLIGLVSSVLALLTSTYSPWRARLYQMLLQEQYETVREDWDVNV